MLKSQHILSIQLSQKKTVPKQFILLSLYVYIQMASSSTAEEIIHDNDMEEVFDEYDDVDFS